MQPRKSKWGLIIMFLVILTGLNRSSELLYFVAFCAKLISASFFVSLF